jgi:PPK2 family polyphosphate:nucleotide phosphotransferase
MARDNGARLCGAIRVEPGAGVRLADIDPRAKPIMEKRAAEKQITEDAARINALQDQLYAEGKRALLVVLQGIDTSGKDGTVRSVFNDTGPIGVMVSPFRAPSADELAHDYLRRAHLAVPRRGTIGIFNRSHYEDVLVVKVRNLAPAAQVEQRYEQINQFEKMLSENGTTILKFMLYISKEEQGQRLQERLDEPHKRWKFNPGDLEDRKLWNRFLEAYEIMVNRCSTPWAPWYVVPADRNWVRNFAIARVVRQTLETMGPVYPAPEWKPSDFKIV